MSEFTLDTNYIITDCIRIARDMIEYAKPGYPQATRDYLRGEYTALSVMLEVHGKDDDKSQRFLKAVAAWKADQIAAEELTTVLDGLHAEIKADQIAARKAEIAEDNADYIRKFGELPQWMKDLEAEGAL